jgi:hypothetical protein
VQVDLPRGEHVLVAASLGSDLRVTIYRLRVA